MFRTGDVKREDTRLMADTLLPYKHKQASGAKLWNAYSCYLINSMHSFLVLQLGRQECICYSVRRQVFLLHLERPEFHQTRFQKSGTRIS